MAIIITGPTVAGIRGTVAGVTFSSNSHGPYCKLWSRGANPRSPAQQTTRSRMSLFNAPWLAMSAGDRAAWDNFGLAPPEEDYNSLGVRIYLSGWQWFCRINQRRLTVGQAVDPTLPSDVAVTPPASVSLSLESQPGGTCAVHWPAATFGATDSAILTMQMHATVGLLHSPWNQAIILARFNPDNTTEDITTAMVARFGNFTAGAKGFATLYKQREDGVRSTPVTTTEEVV